MSSTSQNVPSLTMSGGAKIEKDFYYTATGKPPSISNGAAVQGVDSCKCHRSNVPDDRHERFRNFRPLSQRVRKVRRC